MPRGGARPGAGRPKKPLSDKVLEGNPGKRELTVVQFDERKNAIEKNSNSGDIQRNQTAHTPRGMPSYLDMIAKEGGETLPPAGEIFSMLTAWVTSSGCGDIVAPSLVEDFAFLRRAYLECEYMNRKLGRIASGKRSPYVNMALDYQKAMMAVYNQIWTIVSQNSQASVEGKNEFLSMLMNRGF
jgi:hypothetical protein